MEIVETESVCAIQDIRETLVLKNTVTTIATVMENASTINAGATTSGLAIIARKSLARTIVLKMVSA